MNYTIKSFIKDKNETVSSVANKLKLSRPTFDSYIEIYENNEIIPKQIYQKVFDGLFADVRIPTDVFKGRLEMYEMILAKGRRDEDIDFISRRADRVSKLMNRLRENIEYEEIDKDLYDFIDVIIQRYSDNAIYQMVQFFLRLYGKKDVNQTTNLQMAFFSELFHTFNELDQNEIAFNYLDWDKYRQTCQKARMKEEMRLEIDRLKNEQENLRRQLYENRIW